LCKAIAYPPAARPAEVGWVDNDGKLDILITGNGGSTAGYIAQVWLCPAFSRVQPLGAIMTTLGFGAAVTDFCTDANESASFGFLC
jgi:hypothetical protein